ncbi:MAG: hypothetical protein ACK48H_15145 [Microcystis sp.]|uniref:hypothetical protein n=1 Tax=Microcystis sp. TaxID=1127 RepID=UPI00391B364F
MLESGDYFYLSFPLPHFPTSPLPHHPTPYTPHPTPYTPHPTPHTPHPTDCSSIKKLFPRN